MDVCTGGLGFLDLLDRQFGWREQGRLCAQGLDKERTPLWVDTVGEQLLGQGAGACQGTKLGRSLSLHPGQPPSTAPPATRPPRPREAHGGKNSLRWWGLSPLPVGELVVGMR